MKYKLKLDYKYSIYYDMLCIYIQLQWRKVFKAVFNLQKILSLQSRTQMIILFLALVGFITFFFADDDNILSYRQGISILWLDWSTMDLLVPVSKTQVKHQNTRAFKNLS